MGGIDLEIKNQSLGQRLNSFIARKSGLNRHGIFNVSWSFRQRMTMSEVSQVYVGYLVESRKDWSLNIEQGVLVIQQNRIVFRAKVSIFYQDILYVKQYIKSLSF